MTASTHYQIWDTLYESDVSIIYRGIYNGEHLSHVKAEGNSSFPVVLKVLRQEPPSIEQITYFQREYEMTCKVQGKGVVRAYALEDSVMVLEDFGGKSLKQYLLSQEYPFFSIQEFLEMAIEITGTLEQIHKKHVMHKALSPSNLIWNSQTKKIKLADFGMASELSREIPPPLSPSLSLETLHYLSPEQTGGMNRVVDYRTDFYSLGVIFYELLVGQLPFQADNFLGWVQSHMSQPPVPPKQIHPTIPTTLSEIILKLLSKGAEERYQRAAGLRVDLQQCLNDLVQYKRIKRFPLGKKDLPQEFQMSQKLYGREEEIKTLKDAFERVNREDKIEVVFVSGAAGVGKSMLIHEIHKPIAQQNGYFVSGKFDQFRHEIPYAPLLQAFQGLVKQLLREGEKRVALWKKKITQALGGNIQVVVEYIPELERIVGKQNSVSSFSPQNSQKRFHQIFQQFVQVFAQPEHPLVLFLDDLQWIDSASLRWLEQMIVENTTQSLLFIGAYREYQMTLGEIHKGHVAISEIFVGPLKFVHVLQWIVEILGVFSEEEEFGKRVYLLAECIFEQTKGNPFFIGQLLQSLHREQLIEFIEEDTQEGKIYWDWDLEKIQSRKATDNIVEFMVDKIQKLTSDSRELLKLAACIGCLFSLKTLSIVEEKSMVHLAEILAEGVKEEIIAPLDESSQWQGQRIRTSLQSELPSSCYQFLHDQIQHAAYFLVSEFEKKTMHLKIGRLLLKSTQENLKDRGENSLREQIFDITNQFNLGRVFIEDMGEREDVAKLNLLAGKKAKVSGAQEASMSYLKIGIELLQENCWEEQYSLTLSLYEESIEVSYLNLDFERMEDLALIVLEKANSLFDKIKVYNLKIQTYGALEKYREAVQYGGEVLKLLGVELSLEPKSFHLWFEEFRIRMALTTHGGWNDQQIEENLIDLPLMVDQEKIATIRILSSISLSASRLNRNLYALISLKIVYLSVVYGNAPGSISGYLDYANVLCGERSDFKMGYAFGNLANTLLDKLEAEELKPEVGYMMNGYVRPWKEHIKNTLPDLLDVYHLSLETGNFINSALSIWFFCLHSYFIGRNLDELELEMSHYSDMIKHFKQAHTLQQYYLLWEVIKKLKDNSDTSSELGKKGYQNMTKPHHFHWHQLFLHYFFQDYEKAIESSIQAEKYIQETTQATSSLYLFYDALTRVAVLEKNPKSVSSSSHWKRIVAHQKKLKLWANYAPMNFLHKWFLLEAESLKLVNKDLQAAQAYQEGIQLAHNHGYLQEEALGCELYAKFSLGINDRESSSHYFQKSRHLYQSWGALAKVRDLEKRYPEFFNLKNNPQE